MFNMITDEWMQCTCAILATLLSLALGIYLFTTYRNKRERFKKVWAGDDPQIVYRVAYRSKLNKSCDANELITRTNQFRRFNKARGITGVMFINAEIGEVFQTIEGPHDTVLDLFDRICQDPMHIVDKSRIVHEPFAVRKYSMWNLACHNFPMVDTMNSPLLWGCLMSRTKMRIMDADWENTVIPPMVDTFWITSRADPDIKTCLPFHTIPIKIKVLNLDRIKQTCTFGVPRKEDGSRPDFLEDIIYTGDVTISFLPKFANEHFRKYYEFKHGRICAGGKVTKAGFLFSPVKSQQRRVVNFSEAGFLFSPVNHNKRDFVGVFPASKSFFGSVKSCKLVQFRDQCVKQDVVTVKIEAVGLDDHIRI